MLIDTLHHFDQAVTLAINGLHCPLTDSLWVFCSDKKVWFPFYLLTAVALIHRLGWKKALVVILSVVLTIVACDQTANLFKYAVGRLRPCYSTRMLAGGLHMLEGRGNFFGFFSAHAANTFGFALCAILGFKNDPKTSYRRFNTGVLVWAGLVSLSRIFVAKHYLGDVLVGAAVGCGYGILFGLLAKYLIDRLFTAQG